MINVETKIYYYFDLDDATEVFKCPICVGLGKKAERKCDNEAVYRACHAEDAVCVSTKNGELVMRECQSKKYYNDYIVPKCDGIENCEHAMCEESDCTAYLSKGKSQELMSETQGIREIMQSSKKNLRQHFMTCTLRDHRNKIKMFKSQVDVISQSTVYRP